VTNSYEDEYRKEVGPVFDELMGSLWHVTGNQTFGRILSTGEIHPEPPIANKLRWATARGPDYYPYCRSLGGVSLFDFRDVDWDWMAERNQLRHWLKFLSGRECWEAAIWLAIDIDQIEDGFISAGDVRQGWLSGNLHRRWMPGIEACHKGAIPIAACSMALAVFSGDSTQYKKYNLDAFDGAEFQRQLSEWKDYMERC